MLRDRHLLVPAALSRYRRARAPPRAARDPLRLALVLVRAVLAALCRSSRVPRRSRAARSRSLRVRAAVLVVRFKLRAARATCWGVQ